MAIHINSHSAELLMQIFIENSNDDELTNFDKQLFTRAFLRIKVGLRFI